MGSKAYLLCTILVVAGSVMPAAAAAQNTPLSPAEPAPVGATAIAGDPDGRIRLGLNVVPTPFGSYEAGPISGDLSFAFGVRAFFDYSITRNFFVGIGPTYTFNVIAKDADPDANPSKQLDLLLRVGGGAPVSDSVQLYGYLSPGYSMLSSSSEDEDAKGAVLGINAGAIFAINPKFFVNGELGYQIGFQKLSIASTTVDVNDKLMQIALGAGVRL